MATAEGLNHPSLPSILTVHCTPPGYTRPDFASCSTATFIPSFCNRFV